MSGVWSGRRGGFSGLALLIVAACGVQPSDGPGEATSGSAGEMELEWLAAEGSVIARGLDAATLAELATLDDAAPDVQALRFALYTVPEVPVPQPSGASMTATDPAEAPPLGNPPVGARWRIEDSALRLAPRHPLVPGQRYHAYLWNETGDLLAEAPLTLPPESNPEPSTVITAVYPTADTVPENLLKLYVEFSAPMSPGEVHRHLHLRRADGSPVETPFVAPEHELWDPERRRLTLFFDPGRIKRGVGPHEDLGPILEAGRGYTLEVDRGLRDAQGATLAESYRRTFRVVEADRASPRPESWGLAPPVTPGEPLEVLFPEPLDRALLDRLLWVETPSGRRVPGEVEVPLEAEERLWRFRPETPWRPGSYRLVVDTALEDLAGNSLRRLFDVETLAAAPPGGGEGGPTTEELRFTVSFQLEPS